jgi:hypothetical protein
MTIRNLQARHQLHISSTVAAHLRAARQSTRLELQLVLEVGVAVGTAEHG